MAVVTPSVHLGVTDTDIRLMLAETNSSKQLVITSLLNPDKQVGPESIDLRPGSEFLETPSQNSASVDPFAEKDPRLRPVANLRTYVPLSDQYVLHPGQFALGATLEFVAPPDVVISQVLSRSLWGRLGLLVATAVAVQPGFGGSPTLELVNAGQYR